MVLVEIDFHPDEKKLRSFATAAFIAGAVAAFVIYAVIGSFVLAAVVAAAGFAIMCTSIVSLAMTRAVYIALTCATWPVGWAISFVLMAAVYFLVLTPVGLFFRLIGRDELKLRIDRSAGTYWRKHRRVANKRRYFRQS
jgi:hypothetical protein